MPRETVGEAAELYTADHPPRKDSAEYVRTRKWLVREHGACVVCGDPKVQDHHGGGLWSSSGLLGLSLGALEWSLGWSADPAVVEDHVAATNQALALAGQPIYGKTIGDTASVMAWVDSPFNANVPLCEPHHIGRMDRPSRDHRGHEAVGIHQIPFPIWVAQVTCDWSRWDMWAGTTGTAAVGRDGDGNVIVLHADQAHHPGLAVGAHLASDHPLAAKARVA